MSVPSLSEVLLDVVCDLHERLPLIVVKGHQQVLLVHWQPGPLLNLRGQVAVRRDMRVSDPHQAALIAPDQPFRAGVEIAEHTQHAEFVAVARLHVFRVILQVTGCLLVCARPQGDTPFQFHTLDHAECLLSSKWTALLDWRAALRPTEGDRGLLRNAREPFGAVDIPGLRVRLPAAERRSPPEPAPLQLLADARFWLLVEEDANPVLP